MDWHGFCLSADINLNMPDNFTLVNIDNYNQLLNAINNSCLDDKLILNLPRYNPIKAFRTLMLAMASAPNFSASLDILLRYQTVLATCFHFRRERTSNNEVIFHLDIVASDKLEGVDLLYMLVLRCTFGAIRWASDGEFALKDQAILPFEICITAKATMTSQQHIDGVAIRYGADNNALVFNADSLERPMGLTDESMHQNFVVLLDEEMAELSQKDLTLLLINELHQYPDNQLPTMGQLSDKLNISTRTLQRNLSGHGYRFSELKDQIRRQRALLGVRKTQLPIKQVAYSQGYRSISAFNRAFFRWTGMSPCKYRNKYKTFFDTG
ncbi:AraC family transcriptional regulator [Aliivibrio fischeri]|uniref:AraC family transcriptional regulator n=1 Tax=Aliivibrio fischeri TaxID=668 RepID=UPI0018C552BD|nr:AraC family transcriptional regulator [Aliivibrio fischeri]